MALHGFDVYGLEISETGVATARRYAEAELGEPTEYNYHDLNTWSSSDIGNVTIIAGDFFQKGWEPQGFQGFDVIYDYTVSINIGLYELSKLASFLTRLQFLCALHPSMRQGWARRMHELLAPDGVLICLEFPLWKDLTLPGPPWGLKGVYWNLLAMGGNGIINQPGEEEIDKEGPFRRLLYFKPQRSYENGRGTDMVSVWSALPWQFPDDTHE